MAKQVPQCAPRALRALKSALTTVTSPLADEVVNALDAGRLQIGSGPDMLEAVRACLGGAAQPVSPTLRVYFGVPAARSA